MANMIQPDGSYVNLQIGNKIEESDSNRMAITRDGSDRITYIEIQSNDYFGSADGDWTVQYQFNYNGVETVPSEIIRNVINTV